MSLEKFSQTAGYENIGETRPKRNIVTKEQVGGTIGRQVESQINSVQALLALVGDLEKALQTILKSEPPQNEVCKLACESTESGIANQIGETNIKICAANSRLQSLLWRIDL